MGRRPRAGRFSRRNKKNVSSGLRQHQIGGSGEGRWGVARGLRRYAETLRSPASQYRHGRSGARRHRRRSPPQCRVRRHRCAAVHHRRTLHRLPRARICPAPLRTLGSCELTTRAAPRSAGTPGVSGPSAASRPPKSVDDAIHLKRVGLVFRGKLGAGGARGGRVGHPRVAGGRGVKPVDFQDISDTRRLTEGALRALWGQFSAENWPHRTGRYFASFLR